jgi:ribosomal protein S18 acetylase RimI-like enzyme
MKNKVIIRKASISDLPRLVMLGVAQAHFHEPLSNYNRMKKSLPQILKSFFRKKIRSGKARFLVAEVNNQVVGYALAQIKNPVPVYIWRKEIELSDLFVKDGFRHKGIGKKLVAAVKLYAKEQEADYIWLAVDAKNTFAKKFYKSVGMQPFRETLIFKVKA